MKTLIEKCKPLMEYKFKDGNSVPVEKYRECAEKLEMLETKYTEKNLKESLNDILPFCVKTYAENGKIGGGILELLEDHPDLVV